MPKKLDEGVVTNFIKDYQKGLDIGPLSEKYKISESTIRKYLKRNRIKIRKTKIYRKYPIRENYFDSIDSQEKAYFLGMLYADGTNSTKRGVVRLWLADRDRGLLEKLNNLIHRVPVKPLRIVKKKLVKINGITIKTARDQYELTICNKNISQRLSKLGMVPAKSNILTFPNHLKPELIRHFIRGYFDGDGSIYITKQNQISLTILGTYDFCKSLKRVVAKELNYDIHMYKATNGVATYSIEIHGNRKNSKFLNWLYEGSTIHMKRKYDKFQEAKKLMPKRYTHCIRCGVEQESFNGYCKKHYHVFWRKRKREKKKIT